VGSFCAVLGSSACPESIREEALLPTFLLLINELDKKSEKKKKLAKWEAVSAQIPVSGNWQ
jgi:hypothetical protein